MNTPESILYLVARRVTAIALVAALVSACSADSGEPLQPQQPQAPLHNSSVIGGGGRLSDSTNTSIPNDHSGDSPLVVEGA